MCTSIRRRIVFQKKTNVTEFIFQGLSLFFVLFWCGFVGWCGGVLIIWYLAVFYGTRVDGVDFDVEGF